MRFLKDHLTFDPWGTISDGVQRYGLSASASAAEVKKAKRSVLKKLHPDLNKKANAHETFTAAEQDFVEIERSPLFLLFEYWGVGPV